MQSVILHPKNKEQLAAVKAFAKALKMSFETKEEENSLFLSELKEAVEDVKLIKSGNYLAVQLKNYSMKYNANLFG